MPFFFSPQPNLTFQITPVLRWRADERPIMSVCSPMPPTGGGSHPDNPARVLSNFWITVLSVSFTGKTPVPWGDGCQSKMCEKKCCYNILSVPFMALWCEGFWLSILILMIFFFVMMKILWKLQINCSRKIRTIQHR